jgi:hypothetical protein
MRILPYAFTPRALTIESQKSTDTAPQRRLIPPRSCRFIPA